MGGVGIYEPNKYHNAHFGFLGKLKICNTLTVCMSRHYLPKKDICIIMPKGISKLKTLGLVPDQSMFGAGLLKTMRHNLIIPSLGPIDSDGLTLSKTKTAANLYTVDT